MFLNALVALELGNVKGAIDDFSAAIHLDSQVEYYWRRAILYGEGGEYDKAIADYDRAIELDPDNNVLWRNRAIEAYRQSSIPSINRFTKTY